MLAPGLLLQVQHRDAAELEHEDAHQQQGDSALPARSPMRVLKIVPGAQRPQEPEDAQHPEHRNTLSCFTGRLAKRSAHPTRGSSTAGGTAR